VPAEKQNEGAPILALSPNNYNCFSNSDSTVHNELHARLVRVGTDGGGSNCEQIITQGGWATLRGKYNAGLSLNVDQNKLGCATSRAFEKWLFGQPAQTRGRTRRFLFHHTHL